jgi:hypothetical protein
MSLVLSLFTVPMRQDNFLGHQCFQLQEIAVLGGIRRALE